MSLPREITATLLLAHPTPIDILRLRSEMKARFGPTAPEFATAKWRRDPLLSARDVHIRIRARDLPLNDDRFDTALRSGLSALLRETPESCVARHRAAITVTTGIGANPSEAKRNSEPVRQESYDRMLMLAHAATTRIAQTCLPLAMHWGPSDQILSGARFSAMADMLFPLPLYLHPQPRHEQHAGVDWMALEIAGAQELIGQPLRCAPAPVTLSWIMPRVYAFVAHLRASGMKVTEGMAFATCEGERFTVRLDEEGGIRLQLEEKDARPVPRAEAHLFTSAA